MAVAWVWFKFQSRRRKSSVYQYIEASHHHQSPPPLFTRGRFAVTFEWDFLHNGRGTGMIASSSTFRPHLGRVIRDLSRLLDAVYGIVRKH